MARFPFAILGFDLDGTLLDTSADLAAALNHVLIADGRPPLAIEQVLPMVGQGTRHMLAEGLAATGGGEAAAVARLYPLLLDRYAAHIAVGTRPYPGMIAALDALAARGVTLAVVTNKLEALARRLLDALELTPRFACVIGGDTMGPGNAKPSPLPIRAMIERCGGGRAAFVGDSRFDIAAARAAGVPGIAVRFGFSTEPVEALGADAVIDGYAALLPVLEQLGATARPDLL